MNPLVYTLRDDNTVITQGPKGGGVYISQVPDGSFVATHTANLPRAKESGVEMSQYDFAEIFGRVPLRGLTLRADVFIRLCRLGGLIVHFDDLDRPTAKAFPDESRVMIRTEGDDEKATGKALVVGPDGNFRLISRPLNTLTGGLEIDFDRFEAMFGTEPRDYFANEILRISTLGRLVLRVSSSEV